MGRDGGAVWRGMTAGFIAAGVMSALRLAAHRAGLLDRTVPQELHTELTGVDPAASAPAHQLAAELMHHAVAAAAGGVFAAAAPARPSIPAGLGLGLALWVVDMVALIPALRVRRTGGHAIDFVSHAVYGAIVALTLTELSSQRPTPVAHARRRRVG